MWNKDKTGHVYLDLPLNDKKVKDYYVCKVCAIWLKIPIPDICKDSEVLAKLIQEKHYKDKL